MSFKKLLAVTAEQNKPLDVGDENAADGEIGKPIPVSEADSIVNQAAALAQKKVDEQVLSRTDATAATSPAKPNSEQSAAKGENKNDLASEFLMSGKTLSSTTVSQQSTKQIPQGDKTLKQMQEQQLSLAEKKALEEALIISQAKKLLEDISKLPKELQDAELEKWCTIYGNLVKDKNEDVEKLSSKLGFSARINDILSINAEEKVLKEDSNFKSKTTNALNTEHSNSGNEPASANRGNEQNRGGQSSLAGVASQAGHTAADAVEHGVGKLFEAAFALGGLATGAVWGAGKGTFKAIGKRVSEKRFAEGQSAERLSYIQSIDSLDEINSAGDHLNGLLNQYNIDVHEFGENFLRSTALLGDERAENEILEAFHDYSAAVVNFSQATGQAAGHAEEISEKCGDNTRKDMLGRYNYIKDAIKALPEDIKRLPVSEELVNIMANTEGTGTNKPKIIDALENAEQENPESVKDALKKVQKTETKLDGLMEFINKAITRILALFSRNDNENKADNAAAPPMMP